ncbi:MAG: class I SAM-dependent methyltransferase [Gammaproteobacteria bacterium]|nr:class I SAM-dependent methyltransferase [Gammaproteobacteria bacterium]
MKKDSVLLPSVMPVDREQWGQQLHLCNFVNAYYQYEDIQSCGNVKKILIIGPGQGLDTNIFKWRGFEVTTFDIDETFRPDVIGSAHDLSMFGEKNFDVIIASHVLEHLPIPYLDQCLAEFARVSAYSIIYLPVAGRHFQFQIKLDVKGITLSFMFDLFNFLHKPDGVTARYCQGMHYWEMGMRGFTSGALARRFSNHFSIVKNYRNKDWNPSYNWILKSKA